jgi:LemA protein
LPPPVKWPNKRNLGAKMSALLIGAGVIVLFGLIVVMMVIGIYNKLVRLRNQFKNAYSQIDVQLNRRYDLIPNLLESVKGYMKHERETLEAVIEARNQAAKISVDLSKHPGDAADMKKLMAAEGALTQSLGKLFALSESYPDLKADGNFKQLMEELTSTENKVGFARQAYNDAVMMFNTAIEEFPSNIIAGMFNFTQAEFFEVEEAEARKAVKIKF